MLVSAADIFSQLYSETDEIYESYMNTLYHLSDGFLGKNIRIFLPIVSVVPQSSQSYPISVQKMHLSLSIQLNAFLLAVTSHGVIAQPLDTTASSEPSGLKRDKSDIRCNNFSLAKPWVT